MKKMSLGILVSMATVALLCSTSGAGNKRVVSGAGPSTKVVELFFSQFCLKPCAVEYEFVVPAMSTKHGGGVTNSNTYLFGRTGRPLNEAELALKKKNIFLAKVPIAFATGDGSNVASLSLEQVEKISRRDQSLERIRWS